MFEFGLRSRSEVYATELAGVVTIVWQSSGRGARGVYIRHNYRYRIKQGPLLNGAPLTLALFESLALGRTS
jgi:hypothetical protein